MGYVGTALLLLLLFVLVYPVKIYVDYIDGKTKLILKIPPLIKKLVYDSEVTKEKVSKKKKGAKSKKKQVTTENKASKAKAKDTPSYLLMDIVHTIVDVLPHFGKSTRLLLQGVTISRCNIGVLLYEEDPEELGMKCGKMQGVIYSVYPVLCHVAQVKHFRATVLPNFLGQKESTAVELEAGTTVWKLLVGVCYFIIHGGLKLLKSPIMHKNTTQSTQKKKKENK